ncbi:hypothetical protein BDQ17DRAFT_1224530, partial [Cyathus striatus]
LVIIDGLDECKDLQVQSRIITMIANIANHHSVPLQFLIVSRPELKIRNTFSSTDCSIWIKLVLDDHYKPDKDIETYLCSQFSVNWPSQEDISTLVAKSSGQFIYASTVMKYI